MSDAVEPHESDRFDQIVEVERPWGRFRQFSLNEVTTVKIITVDPGESLSEQFHHHRDEFWVVLDEGMEIQVGDDVVQAAVGDEFFVERGRLHRMSCIGDGPARVLEVAFGDFDEDDIERTDDRYGRTG